MSTKVQVPLEDLIVSWIERNADDVAPNSNRYTFENYPSTIEVEFFDIDEPEDGK